MIDPTDAMDDEEMAKAAAKALGRRGAAAVKKKYGDNYQEFMRNNSVKGTQRLKELVEAGGETHEKIIAGAKKGAARTAEIVRLGKELMEEEQGG